MNELQFLGYLIIKWEKAYRDCIDLALEEKNRDAVRIIKEFQLSIYKETSPCVAKLTTKSEVNNGRNNTISKR